MIISHCDYISFPIADVTNYHNCSGLKHHRFIILQFWRSPISFTRLKSGCWQNWFLLGVSEGRICSVPFPAFRCHLHSLVGDSLLVYSNLLFPRSHLLFLPSIFSSSFLKNSYDHTGPMWIIQGNLPISRS